MYLFVRASMVSLMLLLLDSDVLCPDRILV